MKKLIIPFVIAVLFITGCGTGKVSTSSAFSSSAVIGMPNPFVEYDSIEEAEKHLDFTVSVPESIEGYDEVTISVMDDSMFQITYSNSDNEICIRKAKGNEDISGDYSQYPSTSMVEIDDLKVTTRGENHVVYNAIWEKDGYSYSISAGKGIDDVLLITLIEQMK